MVTQTTAIKNFLSAKTHPDLAELYSPNMEIQVNVAGDGAERIEDVFKGRKWHGWTDGIQTWKSFRIPRNANTEPEYDLNTEMKFALDQHVEGIGMTGWDWVNKKSMWVAYDFDAMTGHSEKHDKRLSDADLTAIKDAVIGIPWVSIRKSTGGKGLHLYVHLNGVPTNNHTEHAALARAILGTIVAITGFDFQSKVDICGGNMWVWHRKMDANNKGLELIKKGTILEDIPGNWRDHLSVVSGKHKRVIPDFIAKEQSEAITGMFEELSGQRSRTQLEESHIKLMDYLRERGHYWTFDQDNNMLITHTYSLKLAHEALGLRGVFDTMASGTEQGVDKNCFCFPLRNGAWAIRRYSPGVGESPTWEQDGQGWTMCYLNMEADLKTAARYHKGLEDTDGNFIFRTVKQAAEAAKTIGIHISYDSILENNEASIKEGKDNKIIVSIKSSDAQGTPQNMTDWIDKKGKLIKVFKGRAKPKVEAETGNYDEVVRHLVTTDNEDFGWTVKNADGWNIEPLVHVKLYLSSLGLTPTDLTRVLGAAVTNCWTVTNMPFQPEYPGDRKWNRNGAKLRYKPSPNLDSLNYPNWEKILMHVGAGLDEAVKCNEWCKHNGIVRGADYLKCWIASLFQNPNEPLPYLFLYSYEQNTGKSIFHEALSLLMTKGVERADSALINPTGFNAELENAILCIVEETNLQQNKMAYNRIKDWVTARKLPVHRKGATPYMVDNTSHWVQCANDDTYCPIFQGDTRITMVRVPPLSPLELVPKTEMLMRLEKEAEDFLAGLLSLEVPPSNDRLAVPIIETSDKISLANSNRTDLQVFIEDVCHEERGNFVEFSELYNRFLETLDPSEVHKWTKIKTGKELSKYYGSRFPKGRSPRDNKLLIGNLSFTKAPDSFVPTEEYYLSGEKIHLRKIGG